jgi:flagellar basal-body rod modification protein FlgD
MSTVSSVSTTNYESESYLTRVPSKTLGQEDFLKILVAQLTSQDPMSPKTDTEFIGQMASFSTLEQSKTMQADLAQMRSDQQLLQANSLLGRTVNIEVDSSTLITGLVSAVHVEAGTPKVVVGDGIYDLDQVTVITPTPLS